MNPPQPENAGISPTRECTVHGRSLQGESHPFTDTFQPLAPVAAIYLHTPFCFHKCHYCDFYSLVDDPDHDRQSAFMAALCREIAHVGQITTVTPQTIFIGGGTPTLLRPSLWQNLLQALHAACSLDRLTEFTVEANPETVDLSLMQLLRDGGVNRVSIGAQSFDEVLLKMLERWHEPASVARAVRTVRQAGIDNINLDLIFAIPGQTLAMLQADLDRALTLEPTHLSCYSLIFEPNTAMTQRLKMGQVQRVDESLERDMYALVMDKLQAAGFEHYEVSNWARKGPGAEGQRPREVAKSETNGRSHPLGHWPSAFGPSSPACLHNLLYWTDANWLGLGPSAASHVDGHRWKNEPHLGRYIEQAPLAPTMEHERLPPDQRIGEQFMLALRLRQGASLAWIDANLPEDDPRHGVIDELIALGLLERTSTHLRLTRQGLFVADSVIAKLL